MRRTAYISINYNITEHNPYMNTLKEFNWKSVQKYVEVRPGAFSFYWLYYADGTSVEADKKPLIIWIQGGPGLAASGIANFAEIGPLDMDMQPRNHTWVNFESIFQKINLCFEHINLTAFEANLR